MILRHIGDIPDLWRSATKALLSPLLVRTKMTDLRLPLNQQTHLALVASVTPTIESILKAINFDLNAPDSVPIRITAYQALLRLAVVISCISESLPLILAPVVLIPLAVTPTLLSPLVLAPIALVPVIIGPLAIVPLATGPVALIPLSLSSVGLLNPPLPLA